MITELFFSHILSINRGSIPYKNSVFKYRTDQLKMVFRARKLSGAFEKQAPEFNNTNYIETKIKPTYWVVVFAELLAISKFTALSRAVFSSVPRSRSFSEI